MKYAGEASARPTSVDSRTATSAVATRSAAATVARIEARRRAVGNRRTSKGRTRASTDEGYARCHDRAPSSGDPEAEREAADMPL